MPAICVKDVDQQEFVVAFAAFLKKSGKIKVPAWADQVKTAVFKQLSPYDQDWWVIIIFSMRIFDYLIKNILGITFDVLHWPATCTWEVTPVLVLSEESMVAPRIMVSLHPTSDKPTETSSER